MREVALKDMRAQLGQVESCQQMTEVGYNVPVVSICEGPGKGYIERKSEGDLVM